MDLFSPTPVEMASAKQDCGETQPSAAKTTYSLLDMDLCVSLNPDLSQPLIPLAVAAQNVVRDQDGCSSSWTTELMEEPVDTHITIKATLEKEFQNLREAQKQHKEDLEKTVTTLFEKITATHEQRFQHLHETLDKQSSFLRREFAANLNWRLTHHHTEILKDIKEFMTPVTQSVHHLQEDVWKLSQNMDNVSQELGTMKQTLNVSALAPLPVSAAPKDVRLEEAQRQRLQSTVLTDTAGVLLTSEDSPVLCESRARLTGKCPVKLLFPAFGKMEDEPDPLLYLEKCSDFLALNPLMDEELMATLRNVLHGTARDWWDVVRLNTHTWSDFQQKFRAAFLSEDYEDELAERVRTRVQCEGESIRDFAFRYRSLCQRWKPEIQEDAVLKLIFRNINPNMASQLRGRVTTVDELVRLGQQLEKDRASQTNYEQRTKKIVKQKVADGYS